MQHRLYTVINGVVVDAHSLVTISLAQVKISYKAYDNSRIVKIKWYGLPYWPLLVSGELYRAAFRAPASKDLGVLRYHVVLAYDKQNDLVTIGRKPWHK
jgi:hypothetical protein